MTSAERASLMVLARQREKMAIADAREYAATLLEISLGWYGRGENASAQRRTELRHVAQTETDRRLKAAEAAIKKASVEAQERILVAGLSSEACGARHARDLAEPQQLLPALDLIRIEPAPTTASGNGSGQVAAIPMQARAESKQGGDQYPNDQIPF